MYILAVILLFLGMIAAGYLALTGCFWVIMECLEEILGRNIDVSVWSVSGLVMAVWVLWSVFITRSKR